MTGIDFQVQMIRQKTAGRALAIIGNDSRLENALRGSDLCISAYITRDSEKANVNSNLKPISFLTGKREEYFLIVPDKQENEADISVFENMGYRNNEDIFWSIHKPVEADKGRLSEN